MSNDPEYKIILDGDLDPFLNVITIPWSLVSDFDRKTLIWSVDSVRTLSNIIQLNPILSKVIQAPWGQGCLLMHDHYFGADRRLLLYFAVGRVSCNRARPRL